MKIGIAETLMKASGLKTKEEKIDFLRKNWSPSIGKILDLAYNPDHKWLLPEGAPPYKPTEFLDQLAKSKIKYNKYEVEVDNRSEKQVKQFKMVKDKRLIVKHFNRAVKVGSVNEIIKYSEEL